MIRFIAFLLLAGGFGIASVEAAKRPNFVWLVSEDNSAHYLKLFDKRGAETPRIAALAKHGLLFEQAFSNAPVCSVARTTLITGCYAPRIGTQFHRKSTAVPMPKGLRMFPAYLRSAGYFTSNNRKKDYNAVEGKGVWDESSARASWRNRKPGRPFFYMQSFPASHESSLHFTAAMMKRQKTATDPKTVFVAPYHPDTPTFRYTAARYRDRIREIDRQIGQVVDRLSLDGLLEDTFIFYFGDHGGVLPGSKGYVYESGLHVPLVVRVPKNWRRLVDAKLGARVTGFVSFIDFGPTLLHLAGIKVPAAMDGRPFLGKDVKLADVNRRDETFGHADRFDEKYDLVRSLRKGRFKYIRSYQPFNVDGLQNNYRYRMLAYQEWRRLFHAGKLNAVQRQFFERRPAEALFDLQTDPHETKDLAGDQAHRGTLVDLRKRLTDRVKGMPDLSVYPESELAKVAFRNPTAFGQKHKTDIAALVDVADLSLVPFAQARDGIRTALTAKDPWRRYWGLIACSSHGESAKAFLPRAKLLATKDPERLVRVRAAEFLGLIAAADPRKPILDALKQTDSGIEATLILNTLVLLRDGKPGFRFALRPADLKPAVRRYPLVQRRLEYLNAGKGATGK